MAEVQLTSMDRLAQLMDYLDREISDARAREIDHSDAILRAAAGARWIALAQVRQMLGGPGPDAVR